MAMFEIPSFDTSVRVHSMPKWQSPEMETLVCPFSICPGLGSYVELFLIDAFLYELLSKLKRVYC